MTVFRDRYHPEVARVEVVGEYDGIKLTFSKPLDGQSGFMMMSANAAESLAHKMLGYIGRDLKKIAEKFGGPVGEVVVPDQNFGEIHPTMWSNSSCRPPEPIYMPTLDEMYPSMENESVQHFHDDIEIKGSDLILFRDPEKELRVAIDVRSIKAVLETEEESKVYIRQIGGFTEFVYGSSFDVILAAKNWLLSEIEGDEEAQVTEED